MKIKRIDEYPVLERLIIKEIWHKVKDTAKDGNIRSLKAKFIHQNQLYDIDCEFLLTSDYLRIVSLEAKQNNKLVMSNSPIKTAEPIYKEIYI